MPGRPAKPIEQHLLDGTFRADRHGPPPDEPDAIKPPRKPASLGGSAAEVWDELTALLVGVVRDRDAPLLAELCRWWSELKRVRESLAKKAPGVKGYNQLLTAAGMCSDRIDKIASRFGLTPSDRAKLRTEYTGPAKPRAATKPKTAIDLAGPPVKPRVAKKRRSKPKIVPPTRRPPKGKSAPVPKSRPKTTLDRRGK